MQFSDLEIGKVYTFNTLSASILGAVIKNATLLGKITYDIANKYDSIDLKFRRIYPTLPSGTVNNAKSTPYYLFKSQSGEQIVLAEIWIQESSLELVDNISFTVKFTDASLTDMSRVRDLLNAAGYTNFAITQD